MGARKYHFKQLIISEEKRRGRRYTQVAATFGRVPDRVGGGGVGGASPRLDGHEALDGR